MGIGLDMLQAKQSGTKATAEEQQEGAEKPDASIIPLGMPMLAGPGAISTVMVLVGESHSVAADRHLRDDFADVVPLVLDSGGRGRRAQISGRNRDSHPDAADGTVAGGAGGAVHRERANGFRLAEATGRAVLNSPVSIPRLRISSGGSF